MTLIETMRGLVALLFFQTSWSYLGRQGLGLKFALLWVARTREQRTRIMEHCQGALNTNPFAAGAVVGAIVKAEYDVEGLKSIDRYAAVASTTLAGGGDRFFWQTLRPASGALAVLLGLFGSPLAPLAFLIPFDLLSQGTRALGLRLGYRLGRESLPHLQSRFDNWARQLGWFTAGILGMILVRILLSEHPLVAGIPLLAMIPATATALIALYRRVSATWLLLVFLLILLLLKLIL